MPKVMSYAAVFRGGVTAQNQMVIPVYPDGPAAPVDGEVWVSTNASALRFRQNGVTSELVQNALDEEKVRDVVATALQGGQNLDVTYDDANNTITLDVQDLTSADITDFISAVRGAISGATTATAAATAAAGVVSVDVLDSPKLGGNVPGFYTNVDNHTDGATNHVFTAADDTKLGGIEAGATANATDAFLRDRTNHTGTQLAATISDFIEAARGAITVTDTGTLDFSYVAGALSGAVLDSPLLGGNAPAFYRNVDNHVDGTTNHVFTAADDTKLTGIAAGATANATDEALRDRATHTGTQLAATISDFATAVSALSIDASTLEGATRADIETAVISAITDGAPELLNTLREISEALGDNPDFLSELTTLVGTKSRNFTAALTGGALTEVVTHGLGTRNLVAQVFVDGGDYEDEEYIIRRTGVNSVTVVSEGVVIPAGRRIVIHAVGVA